MSEQHDKTKHFTFDTDELVLVGGLDRNGVWRDFGHEDIKAGKADEFLKDRAERIAKQRASGQPSIVKLTGDE